MAGGDTVRCLPLGSELKRKVTISAFRKEVALVSHCVLGLGTKDEGSVALGEGTFYVRLPAWFCVERVQAGVVVIWN